MSIALPIFMTTVSDASAVNRIGNALAQNSGTRQTADAEAKIINDQRYTYLTQVECTIFQFPLLLTFLIDF